ncbi:MAG: adenosylcobalamin-dependent ribonucleoside-diphosphate reductase [Burkholderiales bacterium]
MTSAPPADLALHLWETRYRAAGPGGAPEADLDATWRRVARALAAAEPRRREHWERAFHAALADFRFLPGGRILAGAGTRRRVTLFNCFVMGTLGDSLRGIFRGLEEGALTMQQGGGVGYDFSPLRPRGARARASGAIASGPVSFMHIWDSMCATLLSTGARRGAMMGTLRCDHPDIEEFVDAKRDGRTLRRFNLSVLVTDAFMDAVARDVEWPLVHPASAVDGPGEVVERAWPGGAGPVRCQVHRRVPARALWERIVRAAYDCAEPGVLFIDRIQRANPLAYAETIAATNPCGEIPLPPYGACDLGSINLTRFVRGPFTAGAALDLDGIAELAGLAVRMLDDVYDVSRFPLRRQAEVALRSRRLGLGITGLADAFIMLGITYGSAASVALAGDVMRTIRDAAYAASVALAREKGSFPCFDAAAHVRGEFVRALPPAIVRGIRRHGLRNSHLTAIAPTGTISLLAGNVSSGLEPAYAFTLHRTVETSAGAPARFAVEDYAYRRYRDTFGADAPLGPAFVAAAAVAPRDQLAVQAALQPFVDNAIAKTVNVPADCGFAAFRGVYDDAYRLGLKGCAAFRPNPVTGAILVPREPGAVPA